MLLGRELVVWHCCITNLLLSLDENHDNNSNLVDTALLSSQRKGKACVQPASL